MNEKSKRGGARPGAGRKPNNEGIPMGYGSYYAPVECLDRVKALAKRFECSEGEVIDRASKLLEVQDSS